MNPETQPTERANALMAYLKTNGIKAGSWKDRVYLNGYPQNVKAYLHVPDDHVTVTDAPLMGMRLVVWVDDPMLAGWEAVAQTKSETMASLAAALCPLGWVAPEVELVAGIVAGVGAAVLAAPDSDIPF